MLSTDKQTDKQTDRQTNQRYQKHNLLCQGGKNNAFFQIYLRLILSKICLKVHSVSMI